MQHKSSLATLVIGTALVCLPAFSQNESAKQSEASVQVFGTFVKSTVQNGVRQTARDSGGILASYRFFFTNHHGVEVNYGISRSTESYNFGRGPVGVNANQHEVTAAYVYRRPIARLKVTPFVEAGGGALVFDPRHFAGNGTQARATAVYGGGADYNLTNRIFIRAEYRGLIYNSPTFGLIGNASADRVTHNAEPSIGLGLRF